MQNPWQVCEPGNFTRNKQDQSYILLSLIPREMVTIIVFRRKNMTSMAAFCPVNFKILITFLEVWKQPTDRIDEMLDQNEKNMDMLILELVMLLISEHIWKESLFYARKNPQLWSLEKFRSVFC